MLRRPPTLITLTAEDIAAYEESRLARLQAKEQARIEAENAYAQERAAAAAADGESQGDGDVDAATATEEEDEEGGGKALLFSIQF